MNTGPAATVRPVRPWPYRFLREKNGVAWILTWLAVENVLSEHFAVAWDVYKIFKSSSIQSSDERIEASQFSMAIT